ncbi:MAG TPA: hypothetical protein VNO50_07010 [Pyrinomonadaceae bacterium]|nr:hypothetical protein [Pyrinomonadaceae bacterium]
MKNLALSLFSFAILVTLLTPLTTTAQKRKVVVRPTRVVVRPNKVVVRRPVTHTRLVVHRAHPIRRVLPNTVVVRPARRVVAVRAPLVFLPRMVWAPTVVTVPAGDRLIWQDTETIAIDDGWVDTNFGVDASGNALFLDINGRADLNFAEVTFINGNVQVVDFNEQAYGSGVYKLLDFSDGRHVKTVRMLAKSLSDETKLAVYLSK